MNEKPKTVHDMPKPDQVKAKDTGGKMLPPQGQVVPNTFENHNPAQGTAPSATPKAIAGTVQGKAEPPKGSGGMTAT